MNKTPKGNRLHIALFGRTNVGKSSLLNLIAGQDVAITSTLAGTTTDVVEKTMELLPIGPVVFLDTAGLDDHSALSELRLKKTAKIFDRTDVALLVTEADIWTEYEEKVLFAAAKLNIPLLVVINKIDVTSPSEDFKNKINEKTPWLLSVSTTDRTGRDAFLDTLKRLLLEAVPDDIIKTPSLVGDLLSPKGIAVLVVPIDLEAPKGRLIQPQVQTIRDALDNNAAALVVKERELSSLLTRLKAPPQLVICDSQAVLEVTTIVPRETPCTTFSILFARQKGDLNVAAAGAAAIETLKPGDKVLIAEACSHHPLQDDIGRVKIPRWLCEYVGEGLQIDVTAGRDYPVDLGKYRLIIHCGACMLTRREMLRRIHKAQEQRVPITNYGLAISFTQGVIKRTLAPFPAALRFYERRMEEIGKSFPNEAGQS
ncbi:MAG TPA: [FeFe] hydrogenase H-cluster maturation GTPase HydF [Syntrophus sp. (in: bacteria)]|nr:[FeFe] hydrogenase H-cluster maturation GTPase HydF [Syntrophus sp. (in: bacteria)]